MSARLPLADYQFIADFAAFCRTRGEAPYDGWTPQECALAQFGFVEVSSVNCAERGVPAQAYAAATDCWGDWTFSALATRLEALLADAPVVRVQS